MEASMYQNVGLCGKSGSGKSTLAKSLAIHGFQHLRTGDACRQLTQRYFQSESKGITNKITDAFRAIDPLVWIKAALVTSDERAIVLDSMRYTTDYDHLKAHGFFLVRVVASTEVRTARLLARGQEFNPVVDEIHNSETELDEHIFHLTIDNGGSLRELQAQVDELMLRLQSPGNAK
jgi:dephospho-CoA kinase